jgi:Protein of unknown function (DUF2911)
MKKKILIGAGILVLILVVGFIYLNNRNRTLSPAGRAELATTDLSITVTYSRPSVRGRVIFGTEESGALQPYGKYWRLGANEATEITFNKDVSFNQQSVKKGTYRIYAVPGAESFDIILNTQTGKWGAFEPDTKLDILKVAIPVQKTASPVEQFTIRLEPIEKGINVIAEWAETKIVMPVTVP